MIVWKWFLRESWSCVTHSSSHHGHSNWARGNVLNSVYISRYKFQLSIIIFFATSIVNCYPTSYICTWLSLIQCNWVIWFPWKASSSIGDLTICSDRLTAENFPTQSGQSKETLWKWVERNSLNVIQYLNSSSCLDDISITISKQSSIKFDTFFSQSGMYFNISVNIFLKYRIFINEVGLIILLENLYTLCLRHSLESNSFSLDVSWNISKVKLASTLIERNWASVLDHGELVVIYGHCKWDRAIDRGCR